MDSSRCRPSSSYKILVHYTLQNSEQKNHSRFSVENQFEIVIKLKVNSVNKGTTENLFLLEIEYAGLFLVTGVPDEQLHPFLLIECPRMLFPFLRRIVSDVTRDGGFPPLNLETIDFLQLYRQELERRQAEQPAESMN